TSGIVEELAARGHDVTVVTALPYHREHRIDEAYRGRLWHAERYAPRIRVLRCYIFVRGAKTNIPGRFAAYLSHTLTTTIGTLLVGRHDAIMAISPPLTIGLTADLWSRIFGRPFVYSVRDVYPDIAIKLGVLKNPVLIWLSRRLE